LVARGGEKVQEISRKNADPTERINPLF